MALSVQAAPVVLTVQVWLRGFAAGDTELRSVVVGGEVVVVEVAGV